MKDGAKTLGIASALAAAVIVSVSLYESARAQGTPPPAGPRNFAPGADQQARPGNGPFAQGLAGMGGAAIAADQGAVYVLRGNTVFVLRPGGNNNRLVVSEQVELPGNPRPVRRGQNPLPPNGLQRRGGQGAVPPPKR